MLLLLFYNLNNKEIVDFILIAIKEILSNTIFNIVNFYSIFNIVYILSIVSIKNFFSLQYYKK